MSRTLFYCLAAGVTLGGVAAVVAAARLLSRSFPARTKPLAGLLLLAYGAVLALRPSGWAAIDLAVLAGAVGGVDVLSMSGGLSRVLIERYRDGTSDLLLFLTLVVPIRGHAVPIVGIGDLLVGGAAAAALLRLGLRPGAVMGTIAAGLLSALVYALWRGGAPALPFLAVAVLVLVLWHSARARGRRPTPIR